MPATYENIATVTVGTATPDINFTSIPGTFTDLVLVFNGTGDGNSAVFLTFNGSTTNYSDTQLYGTGTAAGSQRRTGNSRIQDILIYTNRSTGIYHIFNYANTTTNKTVLARGGAAEVEVQAVVGLWANTAAITSIKLTAGTVNWASGTTATLYGIKAA